MNKPRVAFCGLGIMGSGMARRLLGAGYPLTVYNRNPDRAAPLKNDGAQIATSAKEAATGARIILSMVADDAASRAVWLGENGALAGAAPGTLLIESSTVSVSWIKELAAAATGKQCELLDAPVTGSKNQAAAGELNFLVGGSDGALKVAEPLLRVMSREIVHLGPTGSGTMMKLINNFVCGVQAASLAQAITLIERSGLQRDKAVSVLTTGAPGSPLFKAISARMLAADYTPNFILRLMAKDLAYAAREGENVGLELTTAANALELFREAITGGYAEKDFSSIIEQVRKS